jgi:ribosomal protein S6--L-glutamate ligase
VTGSGDHIGWQEWVALPDVGIFAIKAKIDTGAKTSALHAFDIVPLTDRGRRRVKFKVHPVQRRNDIVVETMADLVDERFVTSSNGEREARYVIVTDLVLGTRGTRWPIEVTLTNRATMNYRMLLGREALRRGLLVDPSRSFVAGRLSHKVYRRK